MKTRVIMVVAMISIALMPAFSNCGISSHKNSDGKTVNIYMPNPITHKTSVYHNLPLAESEAIYKLVNESSDHRKNYFLVDQYVRKNILNIEISQIETDFGRVIKQGTLYVINPGDSLESIWIKAYTYDYYMNNKRIIQTLTVYDNQELSDLDLISPNFLLNIPDEREIASVASNIKLKESLYKSIVIDNDNRVTVNE